MGFKKVAVIGSNSFLGTSLIKQLLLEGNEVLAFGKSPADEPTGKIVFHEFNYPSAPIHFSLLDSCDAIVYCAAAGVQSNKKYPLNDIYHINAFLPIEIVNYLSSNAYQGSFITFGSFFEIGSNKELRGFTEEEVIYSNKPLPNNYCDSKRLLSRFFSNNKFAISWYHLVLPSLYGKGENSNRLVPYLVDCLLNDKPVSLSAGTQVRQYLHIDDLIAVVSSSIKKDFPSGIYNVSPDDSLQIKELVKEIYTACNKPYAEANETIAKPDESMQVLMLDALKLKQALPSWSIKTTIQQGIASYL